MGEQKRANIFSTWHFALVRRLTITAVLASKRQVQLRSWLLAWRSWASTRIVKTKQDRISIAALRTARQRSWVARWSSGAVQQRMRHLAKSWDEQIHTKHLIRLSMQAWSATMSLYARAQAAAN